MAQMKVCVQHQDSDDATFIFLEPQETVSDLKRKVIQRLRLPYSLPLCELHHPAYSLHDNRTVISSALAQYNESHRLIATGKVPAGGIPLSAVITGLSLTVIVVILIAFGFISTSTLTLWGSPAGHTHTLFRGDLCDHASLSPLSVDSPLPRPAGSQTIRAEGPGSSSTVQLSPSVSATPAPAPAVVEGSTQSTAPVGTSGTTGDDGGVSDVSVKAPDGRRRVAVAVSMTKANSPEGYVDCAAALQQSILGWEKSSKFAWDFIAFVRPGMDEKTVGKLLAFEWQVREADVPLVTWDSLPKGWYKDNVNATGCCGFDELIKLNAYSLVEYYRVLHIDTDAMIMQNMDEIWDADPKLSLQYTPGAMPGEMFSGGLMIIRPSFDVLKRITDIIRAGDFRQGVGWEGSGIGWYWGGFTIQGIMPFFYKKKMDRSRSRTLDYCIYNCQSQDSCMEKNTPWKDVRVWQFSSCMKPFDCHYPRQKPLCAASHDAWWSLMAARMKTLGFSMPARCPGGKYQPVSIDQAKLHELYVAWRPAEMARQKAAALSAPPPSSGGTSNTVSSSASSVSASVDAPAGTDAGASSGGTHANDASSSMSAPAPAPAPAATPSVAAAAPLGIRSAIHAEGGPTTPDGKRKVAVSISLTGGGVLDGYVDCAAALAQSIQEWSGTSRFQVDLIAFVLPGLARRINEKLKAFGFRVYETTPPVLWSEIAEGEYKREVNSSGCCGFNEFLKLNAYRLVDYHRVLNIDSDAMIMQNIDEIFDEDPQLSLMYTPGAMKGEMFSGGLMILRPSLEVLTRITDIIRAGDFHHGTGWEGSGVGWYWGGQTIQGMMPFFYSKKMPPSASKRLDFCIYNCQSQDSCHATQWSQVKIWQFSMCGKPFACGSPSKHLCKESHDAYWSLIDKKLDSIKVPRIRHCSYQRSELPYQYIDLQRADLEPITSSPTPGPTPAAKTARGEEKKIVYCEGTKAEFACDTGSTLHIKSAWFGRRIGETECKEPTPVTKTCGQEATFELVKALCEGKAECGFDVAAGHLTQPVRDPCPGDLKYLRTKYVCQ